MRRIINSTYISLDGVIQDPQDWPDNGIEPDGTGTKVQTDLLFACDAMLMGGRTYPPMAEAWMARSGDPFSDRMNSMAKYVVSSTLRDPKWPNTTVISGDPIAGIRRLKDQPGQDIVQYGFGQLSYTLLEHGLLDELRLWVHPLFVGRATPDDLLFRPTETAQFELTGTLALNTGTVILSYRVPSAPGRLPGKTPDDIRGTAPSYLLPPDSYRRGTGKGTDQGNGVAEMTAVVSREHARSTCLTGAAGVLVLAIAFVMMLVAAPHIQHRAHAPARPLAARLASDPCHQLTSRSDSATVRACRAGPLAVSV